MKARRHIRIGLLSLMLGLAGTCVAQDGHFSLYGQTPMVINPASTGFFRGQYRASAALRSQWGFLPSTFRSMIVAVDAQVLQSTLGHGNVLAVGAAYLSDRAGSDNIGRSGFFASTAYHKSLGKKHGIGVGFQAASMRIGFDPNYYRFGDQILSGSATTMESFTTTAVSYLDFNLGGQWFYTDERKAFIVGLSGYHLTTPNISFLGSRETLPTRFSLHLASQFTLTREWSLIPALLYFTHGVSKESQLSFTTRYQSTRNLALRFGVSFREARNADAFNFHGGFEFMGYMLMMNYDVNVSGLAEVSDGNGAVELALIKVTRNSKRKVPYLNCPEI